MPELIIDSFAGGGGASVGITAALGRAPDFAINHDDGALAMHAANHPATVHLSNNIWKVDPADVGRGPVGLLWASPDCTHHSKAKGGVPTRVEGRTSRDLGWIVVLWAERRRPRIIILENVEEWRHWGPMVQDAAGAWRPDPARKGEMFALWVAKLRKLGYRVEWRELRACDYGAPTIRKRLFVIARCDNRPIVWPAPTHGAPDSAGVKAGRLKLWRTAAECIDWSLPCPSIFDSAAEIRAKHGVRAKRPLADATLARIAKGVKRYVLDAVRPFIVPITHAGAVRVNSIDEPLRTQTTAHRGEHALVTPFVAQLAHGEGWDRAGRRVHDAREPLTTLHAGGGNHAVVAPHLMMMRNSDKPFEAADAPLHTITAGGAKPHLVAAFLAQHSSDSVGHPATVPVSTIVAGGRYGLSQQGVVAAHLQNLRGSDRRDRPADAPAPTFSAGGNHAALVSAFLAKYYGAGDPSQAVDEPAHTLTTKPRHGLVTVIIAGEPWVIVDIGMRMLTPRERFRAQGFPDGYIIDLVHGGKKLSAEAQGRMVGNSVCPPLAEALVRANCADMAAGYEAPSGFAGIVAAMGLAAGGAHV